jgi:hypothetical protein
MIEYNVYEVWCGSASPQLSVLVLMIPKFYGNMLLEYLLCSETVYISGAESIN